MNDLLKQIEKSKGKDVLNIIKKWMESYSLELRKTNMEYILVNNSFESNERVAVIENENDLIKIIAEYIDIASRDTSCTDSEIVEMDYDYYLLTRYHLEVTKKLNFLSWIRISSREGVERANYELLRIARKNGIILSMGHCPYNNYEGISINENLIKILDFHNIKYPDRLVKLTKEAMANHIEEEIIMLELDDQKYEVVAWIGNLECEGCYTTSNWIDFNTIKKI